MNVIRIINILIVSTLCSAAVIAQENSPYSRYGIGDIHPGQNILNRGMGGISIAYYDFQSVNFTNPAAYSRLKLMTYDIGLDYSSRTLRTTNTTNNFKSAYLIPSYLVLGFPLSKSKNWGMVLGMKPDSKVNYDLVTRGRLPGVDSILNQYTGEGGSYRGFTGFAYSSKNFSIGFNTGYIFGSRNYISKRILVNDTILYQPARFTDSTHFGGLFFQAGMQYQIPLTKKTFIRLGMTYGLDTRLNAKRSTSREVYGVSQRGEYVVDSVFKSVEEKGNITVPGSIGFALLLEKVDKFLISAEFSQTPWSQYRFYGNPDALRDNWIFRMGTQLIPDIAGKNYWGRVAYRAGFYFGPDQVNIGSDMNIWAFTFGTGLPIRRTFYTNQYTTMNLAFEVGGRGTKQNSIRENLFRISLGFNLSDIWFNKRTYQ